MRVRAARLVEHGRPLEVQDVELGEPGPGEQVVEMAYGGFNPVDTYMAMGRVAPDGPLPRTLGSEGSGRAGGQAVMVRGHGLGSRRDGLWATAAIVPDQALVPVPAGVSLEQAAAMGVAGVTAWRGATEWGGVGPGDRVLVLGASGGVGSMLVSLSRSLGATVWGQTAAPAKAAWIGERGAERVIVGDADAVRAKGAELEPTVVFDPLGDGFFGAALEVLTPRGRLVAFGTSAAPTGEVPLQTLYRKGLTVRGYGGLIERDEDLARAAAQALDGVAAGRMEIVVGRTVGLERIEEAFRALRERSVTGKVVIDLRAG